MMKNHKGTEARQLEFRAVPKPVIRRMTGAERKSRAAWWFNQMRAVVESAPEPVRLLAIWLVLAAVVLPARAVDRITATVAITNASGTANGETITVNLDTRTWTNNVVLAASQVLTDGTPAGSKTNLFKQIALNPFSQIIEIDRGSTNFDLVGVSGLALTVTLSAGWGTVSYSTQSVTSLIGVRVPISGEPTGGQQTNIASLVTKGVNDLSTNAFYENAIAVQNLLGNTNQQTVVGIKFFTNAAGQWYGIISNSPAISGNVSALSNGTWRAAILINPTLTNGVNYGNAFSSPGTGTSAEQFGAGAKANGNYTLAVGPGAIATNLIAIAIGNNAKADPTPGGDGALAVGLNAQALNDSTVSIGPESQASNVGSTALGYNSQALEDGGTALGKNSLVGVGHTNSTAIGWGAVTTKKNQIAIGGGQEVYDSGNLIVVSNATIGGPVTITNSLTATNGTLATVTTVLATHNASNFSNTNNFPAGSDIAFGRYALTSLANGNNADIPVGTNAWIEVSGPSGAFTIVGINGQPNRDGKEIWLLNQTGQNMTIANQSGVDATAANRIICLTGADKTVTGNSAAMLKYSASASRWILHYFGQ